MTNGRQGETGAAGSESAAITASLRAAIATIVVSVSNVGPSWSICPAFERCSCDSTWSRSPSPGPESGSAIGRESGVGAEIC